MCLIALAWQVHPRFPLLLAANRDEFHSRPTLPLAFWSDLPALCAGRDLRDGGTWLGVSKEGRLAAVTNVREPGVSPGARSRGDLARRFLAGAGSAEAFAAGLQTDAQGYAGFNLLLWDGESLVYTSNRPEPRWTRVAPGVHGLSNARLDTPWPKVCRLQAAMQDQQTAPMPHYEPLFAALADRSPAEDAALPDTGVGVDLERVLSSPFIFRPETGYGTRCSSWIAIGATGEVEFVERRFAADASQDGETRLQFWLTGQAGPAEPDPAAN